MFDLPTEWQNNNTGNPGGYNTRTKMESQASNVETSLLHRHRCDPIISVPELREEGARTVAKNFSQNVNNDIKTRSSQLSDSHFKDMPKLIKVRATDITTHHSPSLTTSTNDLIERPREFKPVYTKNNMSLHRHVAKDMPYKKVNPEDVVEKVGEKNRYHLVSFEARERSRPVPIVPVAQERRKMVIKY